MKKLILLSILSMVACNKKAEYQKAKAAKTDSINAAIDQHNDSIKILNETNRFADLSGSHKLSFEGDGGKFSGTVAFTKTGKDLYDVSGKASSGKNSLKIDGKIKKVSEKHLNFDGEISQNINGTAYTRKKTTTFSDEGKGNFYRLQDKVNSDGFVDYIDIYK